MSTKAKKSPSGSRQATSTVCVVAGMTLAVGVMHSIGLSGAINGAVGGAAAAIVAAMITALFVKETCTVSP